MQTILLIALPLIVLAAIIVAFKVTQSYRNDKKEFKQQKEEAMRKYYICTVEGVILLNAAEKNALEAFKNIKEKNPYVLAITKHILDTATVIEFKDYLKDLKGMIADDKEKMIGVLGETACEAVMRVK
jgi:hypothetical protein